MDVVILYGAGDTQPRISIAGVEHVDDDKIKNQAHVIETSPEHVIVPPRDLTLQTAYMPTQKLLRFHGFGNGARRPNAILSVENPEYQIIRAARPNNYFGWSDFLAYDGSLSADIYWNDKSVGKKQVVLDDMAIHRYIDGLDGSDTAVVMFTAFGGYKKPQKIVSPDSFKPSGMWLQNGQAVSPETLGKLFTEDEADINAENVVLVVKSGMADG